MDSRIFRTKYSRTYGNGTSREVLYFLNRGFGIQEQRQFVREGQITEISLVFKMMCLWDIWAGLPGIRWTCCFQSSIIQFTFCCK